MTLVRHSLLVLAFLASVTVAYFVSHQAKEAADKIVELNQEIREEENKISALRADWAYLNRGDRLADLVAAHQEALRLEPIALRQLAPLAGNPWETEHD